MGEYLVKISDTDSEWAGERKQITVTLRPDQVLGLELIENSRASEGQPVAMESLVLEAVDLLINSKIKAVKLPESELLKK